MFKTQFFILPYQLNFNENRAKEKKLKRVPHRRKQLIFINIYLNKYINIQLFII